MTKSLRGNVMSSFPLFEKCFPHDGFSLFVENCRLWAVAAVLGFIAVGSNIYCSFYWLTQIFVLSASSHWKMATDLTSVLSETSPAFAVKGSQVKVLSEPSEFYQELCQRAERSRQRIAIAALYLGTGDMAKSLVDCVRRSLKSSRGHTRTIFLLDYCRGNRVDVQGESSCSILAPLISEFPTSCKVSLYHTPDLYGFKKSLLGWCHVVWGGRKMNFEVNMIWNLKVYFRWI